MKIFLTGATGFIGRALVLRLRRDGHQITAFVRDQKRAQSLLGQQCSFLASDAGQPALKAAIAESDAVINLAGEPLLGKRWDEKRLESIRKSRLDVTRHLVEAMTPESAPKVFISTSAVGIYGDGGEKVLTEESESGTDFLATLCRDWEAEAIKARDLDVRVVRLRIGVVLGRGGGALDQMLTPFKAWVGGPIGTGKQYVPWIHIEDLVELIVAGLDNPEMSGAFNATAPNPVTFRAFATALGKQLKRPSFLPVPEFAVKLLFGDASIVLLQGQRAIPAHAQKIGFSFRHQTIESALKDLLDNEYVKITAVGRDYPESNYLRKNPPAFLLQSSTVIDRPIEEVFPFFSRPENLGLITPAAMQFRITSLPENMCDGALIDYSLKVGLVPITWQTRIEEWQDGRKFVDSQLKGPYSCWWHEHSFIPDGQRTIMNDRVFYTPPAGPIGRAVNALFIAGQLQQVFGYRSSVMRLRFG